MLSDRQDTIGRELVTTQAKCPGNGRIDFDVVPRGDLTGHVALGVLVNIKTHDIHARRGHPSIEQIRFEKIFEQNMRVTAVGELRQDDRDLEPFLLRAKRP